jgi:hypothetical protein
VLFVYVINGRRGYYRSQPISVQSLNVPGRIDVGKDGREDDGPVSFGTGAVFFNYTGSNDGQYTGRSDPDSGSNVAYGPISNFSKPFAPASDQGLPLSCCRT